MAVTAAAAGRASIPRWAAFVLLGAVFALKLAVMVQLRDHPLTQPDAGLDTTAYVDLARQVLAGQVGLGPGLYYVSPLYIYFLAAGLGAFDSFTAVRLVQIVLGTASVWFVFLTTREWFGGRAAWLAAILAALTGLFTFYEVLILQASIDAFLTSAALYALARGVSDLPPKGGSHTSSGVRRPSASRVASDPVSTNRVASDPVSTNRVASAFRRKELVLAGVIFGIQTLNRPNILIAAAGVAVMLIVVTRRARPAALLIVGLIVGMAPVAIRNAVVAHEWSLVSSHGGLNFYVGNSERATGFYVTVPGITPTIAGQEKDARRVAEGALGHPVSDAEASSYFFQLAWTWMRAHPAAAFALLARKFYYVFNAQHVALPHSYPFYAYDAHSALRFLAVGPWLLIPLGVAGLLFAPVRRARAGYVVWAAFVPAYAAAVALFFVAERYRLPLLVPLCAGAGAALDTLGSGLQIARGGRPGTAKRQFADLTPVALVAAAAILAGVIANWPLKLNDGRWDEGLRMAQRLVILRRYDEAERWTGRLEAQRGPVHAGAAHYGVGSQLLLLNDPARALPHLEAAHQADPSEPRIDYTLGQALLKAGRPADAVPHLRHGFDAGIEIPGGGFDLAVALQAIGDLRAASAIVARVRLAETEDVEAWLRLGRIAQEAGEPAVAEPYFRRAAAMRPDLARARQQFGLNQLVLGQLDAAIRELGEAARLDPLDADTLAALALCDTRMGRAADARAHAAAALALDPDNPLAKGILRGGGSR